MDITDLKEDPMWIKINLAELTPFRGCWCSDAADDGGGDIGGEGGGGCDGDDSGDQDGGGGEGGGWV